MENFLSIAFDPSNQIYQDANARRAFANATTDHQTAAELLRCRGYKLRPRG